MVILWLLLLGAFAFLVAFCNAHIDNVVISIYRKSPKHWTRAIIRIILFVACSYLPFLWQKWDLILYLLFVTYCCSAFWTFFEWVLNNLRDRATFYVGQTAFLDKMARKYLGSNCGQILFVIKIVLIVASFWLSVYRYF